MFLKNGPDAAFPTCIVSKRGVCGLTRTIAIGWLKIIRVNLASFVVVNDIRPHRGGDIPYGTRI